MSEDSDPKTGDDSGSGLGDEELRVPDLDLDGDLPLSDDGESPSSEEARPVPDEGPALGRRIIGMLAVVLGLIGCLIALFLAFSSLRLLFGASDRVDDAMAPVIEAFDRLEDRIDQADDLIDRQGVEADQVPELRARVDGLVDITSGAEASFDAIDDHPIYSYLPADLGPLGDAIDRFQTSADTVDDAMGTSATVRATAATTIADELDGMQSAVSDTRDRIDDAASSLRRWLRIGGLLGFLASLWGLWAQVALARRGWRGLRNRPV